MHSINNSIEFRAMDLEGKVFEAYFNKGKSSAYRVLANEPDLRVVSIVLARMNNVTVSGKSICDSIGFGHHILANLGKDDEVESDGSTSGESSVDEEEHSQSVINHLVQASLFSKIDIDLHKDYIGQGAHIDAIKEECENKIHEKINLADPVHEIRLNWVADQHEKMMERAFQGVNEDESDDEMEIIHEEARQLLKDIDDFGLSLDQFENEIGQDIQKLENESSELFIKSIEEPQVKMIHEDESDDEELLEARKLADEVIQDLDAFEVAIDQQLVEIEKDISHFFEGFEKVKNNKE
ncbi:MAG: hypothetical protein FJZ56_02000 [Chlamydiae bacterium]|nr:hypothetical protein [Chlamydiota bacterium]